MKKLGNITEIVWGYKNGMHLDTYVVWYENRESRTFKIKGKMINKHFDFIMNAKCETRRNKHGGKCDYYRA